MKEISAGHFYGKLCNKKEHFPWHGQLELTYRCGLSCIHCYCKGSEDQARELSTQEWKNILDDISSQGCLWLCITGGDPLVRDDFLEIYAHAKQRGFIITVFTNGQALTEKILKHFVKSPPFSVEITLNGITQKTYESITGIPGSFARALEIIKKIAKRKLRLILKVNCLKQNMHEIGQVKAFTEDLLGKPRHNRYRFKYDPMIYPRLNGDKTPCQYRLSFAELEEIRKQDPDILEEYQKGLQADMPEFNRDKSFLYRCTSWMAQFFINPYGRLKFCNFSDKFSVDLRSASFKETFYRWPAQILNDRFKTNSRCKDCSYRLLCYHCPGRAYLETGDEEAPVEDYCALAKSISAQMEQVKNKSS